MKTLKLIQSINDPVFNKKDLAKSQSGAPTKYIPLTNRVRRPYRKLRTEFFPLRFMAQAGSARAINRRRKKLGSVIYSADREDEVSKIFIVSLLCF